MTASGPAPLRLLESELARRGLLLQHDRALPSVTTLVVGAPVSGSWWGHPQGKEIYALLLLLERGAGALAVKLINGKVTFVDRTLWPALLALVQSRELIAHCSLSAGARALLAEVNRRGRCSVPQLRAEAVAPAAELTTALRELERSVLVHVDSEHTDSGAHQKQLRSWAHWADAHSTVAFGDRSAAWGELSRAARALSEGSGSARLPWPPPQS
jgi:hypothetical protein